MIVIFEGPRAAGKTTIIGLVKETLERHNIKCTQWKVIRGAYPISDMHSTIDSGEFKDGKTVFLIDRFHLSELVLSRILHRGWKTEDDWRNWEFQLRSIDAKLAISNSLVVMITAREKVLQARLDASNREDPSNIALDRWIDAFHWTVCSSIHISNDMFRDNTALKKYTIAPIVSVIEDMWLDGAVGRIFRKIGKLEE